MSKTDWTYQVSIEGFELWIQVLRDDFSVSIPEHTFPDVDGAFTQNKGMIARKIIFETTFFGDDYSRHQDFKELLKSKELFEFVHPEEGIITGRLKDVSFSGYEESPDSVTVDVTFVEHLRGDFIAPTFRLDIADRTQKGYFAAMQAATDKFIRDFKEAIGLGENGVLTQALDPEKGLLSGFPKITGPVRSFLQEIDKGTDVLNAQLSTIANPANSLINGTNFLANLPGRTIGSIARTAERYTKLFSNLESAPYRFAFSYKDSITQLKKALGVDNIEPGSTDRAIAKAAALTSLDKQIDIVFSAVLAAKMGSILSADEFSRNTVADLTLRDGFDLEGNHLEEEPLPSVVPVVQIERAVNVTRTFLQEALVQTREREPFRLLAYELQEHARTIKQEREKVKTVQVNRSTHLVTVMHRYGLDYRLAPVILDMNPQIKNPNDVTGPVRLLQ